MTQRVKAAGLLIFLFILSLQTSMSAMDFFASLLFILVGVEIYKFSKGQKIQKLKYVFSSVSLWIWISVTTLFLSTIIGFLFFADSEAPVAKTLFEFKWFIFLLSMVAFFSFYNPQEKIKTGFIFTFALVVVYTLSTYFFEIDLFGDVDRLDEFTIRAGGFFSNPMTFAHSFQFFVFMLFASILISLESNKKIEDNKQKAIRLLFIGLLILGAFCIYLTMTRGVWLGMMFGASAGLIFHLKAKAIRPLLGLFLLVVALFLSSKPLQNRVIQTLNPQASYDSERLILWKTNWKIFLESPLFGIGYGENKRLLRNYYDKFDVPKQQFEGHAHNQYLHFLAGTGLFGLISYLCLFFYFIFLSVKIYKNSKDNKFSKVVSLGSFMGLICFFISGMTESNFQHAKLKYSLVLIWSLLIYLNSIQKPVKT